MFSVREWESYFGGWGGGGESLLFGAPVTDMFSRHKLMLWKHPVLLGHMVWTHRVYHSSRAFYLRNLVNQSQCVCACAHVCVCVDFHKWQVLWLWYDRKLLNARLSMRLMTCLFFFVCLFAVYEAPETKPACLDAPYDGRVRLSVSKRGCRPPPERGAEMKGLLPGSGLGPLLSKTETGDWTRRHCKMEHGFGFCDDEMKKTLVPAGRRLINFFLLFFFYLFLFCLSEKKPFCLKRYFRNICKITYFVQWTTLLFGV